MRPMTTTDYALGGLILLVFFAAMLAMLAVHYKLVADAAIEEAREDAKRDAAKQADRLYRRALADAKIHVRQQLRIINESDIDWGKEDNE